MARGRRRTNGAVGQTVCKALDYRVEGPAAPALPSFDPAEVEVLYAVSLAPYGHSLRKFLKESQRSSC